MTKIWIHHRCGGELILFLYGTEAAADAECMKCGRRGYFVPVRKKRGYADKYYPVRFLTREQAAIEEQPWLN